MKSSRLKHIHLLALAVALILPTAYAAGLKPDNIGLQLYSLRDQFQKDVPGTMDMVLVM